MLRLTSQPFDVLASQSANPALQAAIEHWLLLTHAAVAFGRLHVPHCKEPPQPSGTDPQIAPIWAQVVGVHAVPHTPSSTIPLQSLSRPSQTSGLGSTCPEHAPHVLFAHVCVPALQTPTPLVPAGPV